MRAWATVLAVVAAAVIGQHARAADIQIGHLTLDPPPLRDAGSSAEMAIKPLTSRQIHDWIYGDAFTYTAAHVVHVINEAQVRSWLIREHALWTPAQRAPAEIGLKRPGY